MEQGELLRQLKGLDEGLATQLRAALKVKGNVEVEVRKTADALSEALDGGVKKRINLAVTALRKALGATVSQEKPKKVSTPDLPQSWPERVKGKTPKQLRALFKEVGIPGDEWQSSSWLQSNKFAGLYFALKAEHGDLWEQFLAFMSVTKEQPWTIRVKGKTPKQLRALFKEVGIPGDEWQSSSWLGANGFYGLRRALPDLFNGSWEQFLAFMGVTKQQPWTIRVKGKTPKQLRALFKEVGIPGDEWQSSSWLGANGFQGLYVVLKAGHSNSWEQFLAFMGAEREQPWPIRVKGKTPKQLRALFKEIGIPGDEWQISKWLSSNEFAGLYAALRAEHGNSWEQFLAFMGMTKELSWAEHVKGKTPKQLRAMFKELGIPADEWQSSGWLMANEFGGLCRGLSKCHESWGQFLEFMGLQSWAERVKGKTPTQLRAIFKEAGIPGNEWQNSGWLRRNELGELNLALKAEHGNSWEQFLAFMGVTKELSWTERVRNKTPKQLRDMFKEIGIPGEEWQNSGWLAANGFRGLSAAIQNEYNNSWGQFLAFMDVEAEKENDDFDQLDKLELTEAQALLGHEDPVQLKRYLQLAYPELEEDEIDRLVTRSFKGLVCGTNTTKEEEYLGWKPKLPEVEIRSPIPKSTDKNTLTVSGIAKDAECVYVSGALNRRVRTQPDGTFTVIVPLATGKDNQINVMGLDRKAKKRSEQEQFSIKQTGKADDVEALFVLLSQLRTDLLAGIQKDPGRRKFFIACAEKVLIKKFSRSFEDGEAYVDRLARETGSDVIRTVLEGVIGHFRAINKMKFPNVKDGKLMFFQKYCVYEIRKRIRESGKTGRKGLNLANDPGLGKTRTILAALADEEAAIFTPNPVVSAWDEESEEVLNDPDLLVLRDAPHKKRKELLKGASQLRLVTNVQFLQKPDDAERFELLSTENTVVVHDEAHGRANESQQSKGARKLKHKFQINVTATLAKNPRGLRRMLHTLEPDNPHFQNDKAFSAAFPTSDPKALKTLKILVDKYTIRFRKEDVMEEIDPNLALDQQLHRLPRKKIVPPGTMGEFEMSEDQARASYELFLNWPQWTEDYGHYIPKNEATEEDNMRRNGGTLVKKHALRQTVNNPAFIGSKAESPKEKKMRQIVEDCLKRGRKVVIFCAYTTQANRYAEIFKAHKPALYTGLKSKEGEKKDSLNRPMTFARRKTKDGRPGEWMYDAKGYPIDKERAQMLSAEDVMFEPMPSLDYERLSFQNAAERQLLISTEKAGSVGTTFTAGKVLIEDDLSDDIIGDIQKKDRIHRIDPKRQTHADVEYYSLIGKYPPAFLERMKKRWVVKQEDGTYNEYRFLAAALNDECCTEDAPARTAYDTFFKQGTWDEVHHHNLGVQRQMFRLINDGIADESVLSEGQKEFQGVDLENGH